MDVNSAPAPRKVRMDRFKSSVICEVPGCLTTQADVEQELAIFLASYCSVCNKDRNGKICQCVFPCSLIFKASMLSKIVEILAVRMEEGFQPKSFHVCFKHPELLAEARERVLKSFHHVPVPKKTGKNAPKRHEAGPEGQQLYKLSSEGKVQSNGVLQAVNGQGVQRVLLVNPTSQTCLNPDGTLVPMSLAAVEDGGANVVVQTHDVVDGNTGLKRGCQASQRLAAIVGHEVEGDSKVDQELEMMFGESSEKDLSVKKINEKLTAKQTGCGRNVLNVVRKNHAKDVLHLGISELSRDPKAFADLTIVCKDGRILSNSLVLASASPYLGAMLKEINFVEETHMKTIIFPDILKKEMSTFCSMLIRNTNRFSDTEVRHMRTVAEVLQIHSVVNDISQLMQSTAKPSPLPTPKRVVTIKLCRMDNETTSPYQGPIVTKEAAPPRVVSTQTAKAPTAPLTPSPVVSASTAKAPSAALQVVTTSTPKPPTPVVSTQTSASSAPPPVVSTSPSPPPPLEEKEKQSLSETKTSELTFVGSAPANGDDVPAVCTTPSSESVISLRKQLKLELVDLKNSVPDIEASVVKVKDPLSVDAPQSRSGPAKRARTEEPHSPSASRKRRLKR